MTTPTPSATRPDRFHFLHVDLNSFFASVEQQLHPEYRGKPLGVCGTMADTGALIAASYEAKALGIHTLTKVGDAKRLCPDIILVSGSHTTYAEFSHKISAAVERCCPVAHTPSIDEMVCQLIGREQSHPMPAPSPSASSRPSARTSAKPSAAPSAWPPTATSPRSPATCRSPTASLAFCLRSSPEPSPTSSCATSPASAPALRPASTAKGITTMQQLLALDRSQHARSSGTPSGATAFTTGCAAPITGDDGAPVASDIQKSLGHSHVLGPEFRSDEGAWSVAHKLLHKAAMRLRLEHFYAGTMALTIKYALSREQLAEAQKSHKTKQHTSGIQHTAWGMEASFVEAQDTLSLLDVLRKTWAQRPLGPLYTRPFFVGITLRELTPESEHQATLFADPGNRAQLSTTMDKLNLKYGHTTLHFAGMLPARDTAPTRIAFTQIPVQYGVDYM